MAGVGNIYADEFVCQGHPTSTPAGRLSLARLETLRGCLVDVLQASIGAGGTTFSDFRDLGGVNGNYGGQALVYRRGGEPCRRCGATLIRQKLSGRSTPLVPGLSNVTGSVQVSQRLPIGGAQHTEFRHQPTDQVGRGDEGGIQA